MLEQDITDSLFPASEDSDMIITNATHRAKFLKNQWIIAPLLYNDCHLEPPASVELNKLFRYLRSLGRCSFSQVQLHQVQEHHIDLKEFSAGQVIIGPSCVLTRPVTNGIESALH